MIEESSVTTETISFDYSGFQVVRGEFLSRVKTPTITFGDFKVWVNTACIQKFPGTNYIQIIINPSEQKIVLRPCSENVKDSLVWCINRDNIRKPRKVACPLFIAKLLKLMNWDVECRYRIIGDIVSTEPKKIMLFDLNSAESIFSLKGQRRTTDPAKIVSGFPDEWRDNFGSTVEEHSKLTRINVFEDYTVLTLDRSRGNFNEL